MLPSVFASNMRRSLPTANETVVRQLAAYEKVAASLGGSGGIAQSPLLVAPDVTPYVT